MKQTNSPHYVIAEGYTIKRTTILFLLAAVGVVLATESSYSIPAFARKYQTSCMTCHNGFPKLNAFGEAFRRNGYQFPAGADPEVIKEQPVSLGSEGNKKAFPDAIWPGSIPGSSPLSVFLNGEVDYNPKTDPRFTFGGLGSSIEAVAGGTLGEDLSFWGQLALGSEGTVELNRIFLIFSNLIGDNYALNMRVGVLEPGLFSFSTHRAWMEGYWFTTRPLSSAEGDMGWTIEETQKGFEFNGMAAGRFGWSAGIVEGFGPAHSDKDYYLHATYKFGGLPLDGVVEGSNPASNTKPYVDNSVTIGAFGYWGKASLGPDPNTGESPDNIFGMVGGDVNIFYDRFNLFGGVQLRHDGQPYLAGPGIGVKSTVMFAELDVTVFPWLLPGIRFESWQGEALDPMNAGQTVSYTDTQIVPGIVFLVRPNVKVALRGSFAKQFEFGDTKMQPGQVAASLTIGM
jgi:hypothetical protein